MKSDVDRRVAEFARMSARIVARNSHVRGSPVKWLRRTTRPARVAAASIVRQLRKHGRACVDEGGPGVLAQAATMARLAALHSVPPESYYLYRLYRSEVRAIAHRFIEFPILKPVEREIMRANGVDRRTLNDKRIFARLCATHGFPTPPILAWFDDGRAIDIDPFPPEDLFSKPGGNQNGRGAVIWRFEEGSGTWSDGVVVKDRFDLVAELAERSKGGTLMLQPRVTNHPNIGALGSGGACTVRVVTIRFPNRPAELLLSAFKMSANGAAADNFIRGGLLAAIDAESGTLGLALSKKTRHVLQERHPDSGAIIPGVRLPYWKQVVDMCLQFHNVAFAGFPGIGWDVAITPQGPVFIEGNCYWSPSLIQQAHDRPLGETHLPDCYLAHLSVAGMDENVGR